MMVIEEVGKSVEEAVSKAVNNLGVKREQVEVEVIEEPAKGLFGLLGSKPARVRVTVIEQGSKDPADLAADFLQPIFDALDVAPLMEVRERDDYLHLDFNGQDLGVLIGRRGETLDALQYLVNLVVSKQISDNSRLVLDVGGYRRRREETLTSLAKRLAKKVKTTGRKVALEPMNPQERRVIHTALQDEPEIYTFSEGNEPFRKVVIALKKND